MANIQHKDIPDAERHEPKGISSAASNTVYMANGSATGAWALVNRLPGTGWTRYSDATHVGANPLVVQTTEVQVPLTEATIATQLPISYTGTTSPLAEIVSPYRLLFVNTGDLHTVSINFKLLSVSGSPAYINLIMYGSSDGTTYGTVLGDTTVSLLKGAGQVVTETALFPVTTNMVTHGAKLYMVANTGTVNIIDIGVTTGRVHRARA